MRSWEWCPETPGRAWCRPSRNPDYTGVLSGDGTDRSLQEAFVAGTEPNRQYSNRWQTITSLPWYQQRAFYIPKQGEAMAPGTTPTPGAAPGQTPTAAPEGQVVGEGDEGTVVPPPPR